MRGELLARETAGGDRDRLRAENPSAPDVVRGVAEDENLPRLEFNAVFFLRARAGERAKFVAVVMIVGVGAELEKMPHAIMRELDLRAAREIAGEQPKRDVAARFQFFQKLDDARQQTAFVLRQLAREMLDVAVVKRAEIFRAGFDAVLFENRARDARVCAPRDLDGGEIVIATKAIVQREAQRLFTRSAGSQQRAVDVEKNELRFQNAFSVF